MNNDFQTIFTAMMSGKLSDDEICHYLVIWENEGIHADYLSIAAKLMRQKMIKVNAPEGTIDIVGTGGDGLKTYNISTAVCFVLAGAGVSVAKHGNRAVSSKSGASDVLAELGVRLDISPKQAEKCIDKAGIGFLFAPNHHKAMKYVANARARLKTRTIFNRLGPLLNPANVKYYLLGVYDKALLAPYANALLQLGVKRALIAHGLDGMDEITTTAPSIICEINDKKTRQYEITPEEFGLRRSRLRDLIGGKPETNAKALIDLLDGKKCAYRDIVVLNSAAALYAANKAKNIKEGIYIAQQSIDKGNAKQALGKLIQVSNE